MIAQLLLHRATFGYEENSIALKSKKSKARLSVVTLRLRILHCRKYHKNYVNLIAPKEAQFTQFSKSAKSARAQKRKSSL